MNQNRTVKTTLVTLVYCILLFSCTEEKLALTIEKHTVNYFENPLGLDDQNPKFSWVASSPLKNKKQSAYQIIVALSEDALETSEVVWDTGKTASDQNTHLRYLGKPLESGQKYHYKIKIWDEQDAASEWSTPGFWTMGLLKKEDWKAEWISFETEDTNTKDTLKLPPPAYFRKSFEVRKKIKSASLHITALGVYEPSVNGAKVGSDLLTPGWSNYDERIYYNTYDLTDRLTQGRNTLGAILADGWYAGYVGPKELSNPKNRELYGDRPALLCQLEITYADGKRQIVVSDESWKGSRGPLLYGDLLMGSGYDANLEHTGWNTNDFDASGWQAAISHEGTGGALEAYPGHPIKVYDELRPVAITEPVEGTYIFDLGQNFAGRSRLRIEGEKNDTLVLRYGEMLHPDGSLMTENLRFARATDTYILKGEGPEVWEPKFTYHGFRYVAVSGLENKPSKETITGIAFSSSFPMESSFRSSDETLNQLYENVRWTQRSNFMDVPTDSPQRDERLGWLGDIQIFSKSALYNARLGPFFHKWFTDLRDAQYDFGAYANFAPRPYPDLVWYSPGWMEAGVMVPYNTYRFYGDIELVREHYPSMKKFIDYQIEKSKDTGYLYPENSWTEIGPKGGFGDWLSMTEKNLSHDIMASMYFQNALKMVAEMAGDLGREKDAASYDTIYRRSVTNFIDHYLDDSGKFKINEAAYGDGEGYFEGFKGFTGHTQSAYATALYFDILPDSLSKKAGQHLANLVEANDTLPSSGILGIRQLLPALSKIGRSDLAYSILLNRSYPSWGFQVELGATTIWERWNSYTPEQGFNGAMNEKMNSFNHYAFGAFSQYLFENIAGISTEDAGFKNIIIRPDLGDRSLTEVDATYTSINGKIRSAWRIEGNDFSFEVDIPFNTSAKIHIPAKENSEIIESMAPTDNRSVTSLRREGDYQVYQVGSGQYAFRSELP